MDVDPERDFNLEADSDLLDEDADVETMELPGPKPTMDREPDEFQVMSAAQSGPIPPDVERELRQLADAIKATTDTDEGIVATRFGQRVVVAPLDNPSEGVDVADVDLTRQIILTLGGEDPTDQGALLAKVLFQRREMSHGYAKAPDVDGPTFSVLQQVLPALQGPQAVDLEEVGTIALGHSPSAIAGAVQGLQAEDEDADRQAGSDEDHPTPPSYDPADERDDVNRV